MCEKSEAVENCELSWCRLYSVCSQQYWLLLTQGTGKLQIGKLRIGKLQIGKLRIGKLRIGELPIGLRHDVNMPEMQDTLEVQKRGAL